MSLQISGDSKLVFWIIMMCWIYSIAIGQGKATGILSKQNWCSPNMDLGILASSLAVSEVLSSPEGICMELCKVEGLWGLERHRDYDHSDRLNSLTKNASNVKRKCCCHEYLCESTVLTWSVWSPRWGLTKATSTFWFKRGAREGPRSLPKYWRRACNSEFLSRKACAIFSAAAW